MKEFFQEHKLDAILIHTSANMRHISGFTGEGLVYQSQEDKIILTDSRYTIAAGKESPSYDILQNNFSFVISLSGNSRRLNILLCSDYMM